jgi:hypothetical protein
MRRIDRLDQLFDVSFVLWGHPDLVRSRGRRPTPYRTYVRMSRSSNEDLDPSKSVSPGDGRDWDARLFPASEHHIPSRRRAHG